jgi:hypothetical protein
LPTDRGDVLAVTTLPGPGPTADPKCLEDVASGVQAFLRAHPRGLVVLDCIDVLAVHNGVERLLRMVEGLHDAVATSAANLVVFVDAIGSDPRLLANLARELDELPGIAPPSPPDLLLA